MHLIKDENGNLCSHSHQHEHTHTHTYEHPHPHSHEHGHEEEHEHTHGQREVTGCGGCASGCGHSHEHGHDHQQDHSHQVPEKPDQMTALLDYMLKHNQSHAAELDQMAAKLQAAGKANAAEQIKKAVDEFQKGNLYLGLALSMVKEG